MGKVVGSGFCRGVVGSAIGRGECGLSELIDVIFVAFLLLLLS